MKAEIILNNCSYLANIPQKIVILNQRIVNRSASTDSEPEKKQENGASSLRLTGNQFRMSFDQISALFSNLNYNNFVLPLNSLLLRIN